MASCSYFPISSIVEKIFSVYFIVTTLLTAGVFGRNNLLVGVIFRLRQTEICAQN